MKLAVIGSGAAAHAVLAEIARRQPDAQVDVYDAAEPQQIAATPTHPHQYASVYRALKAHAGLKFPPPKSHFGALVDSRPEVQMTPDWQRPGGLTNYWGATCLPFGEHDLATLGLSRAQLDPYYERVAQQLAIAGDADSALARQLEHRFIDAAPLRRLALFERLDAALAGGQSAAVRFVAGDNAIALDTDAQSPTSCTYCGHCLAGCYRGSLFNAADERAKRHHPRAVRHLAALVERVDLQACSVHFTDAQRTQCSASYDRIFIAAGCVQSTAIALRSTGLQQAVQLYDNAIVQFPILYTGRALAGSEEYFALSQSLIACFATDSASADVSPSMIQVYPVADHLLRSAVPEACWPLLKPLAGWLRSRMVIARLYLHSDVSHRYQMQLRDGAVSLRKVAEPDLRAARPLIEALRQALRPAGFRVLGALTAGTRTSSHFAGSLTETGAVSAATGALSAQVYCCDGALFRCSPAASPTFSIMANATRVAEAAL